MKKISTLLLAIGMVAAVFTSCKKENEETTKFQFTKLVKSVTRVSESGSSSTINYTYDNNKRLIKEVAEKTVVTYTYTESEVTRSSQYDNDPPRVTKIKLENGRATTITEIWESGSESGSGSITSVSTVTYDPQGHLTQTESKNNGVLVFKSTYIWTNGNQTSETSEHFGPGASTATSTSTSTYKFGTYRNLVNINVLSADLISEFMGAASVNLPESEMNSDDPEYSVNYVYEFDAEQCPTKITETTLYNGSTYKVSYTLTY